MGRTALQVLSAAILLHVSMSGVASDGCTSRGFVPSPSELVMEPEPHIAGKEGEGFQVLIPGLSFSCHGYVKSWSVSSYVTSPNIASIIILQVWRPLGGGNFRLLHSNSLTFDPADLETVNNSVLKFTKSLEDNNTTFQPGDVVGVFVVPLQFRRPMGGQRLTLGLLYQNTLSDDDRGVTMYSINSTEELCEFSTCDLRASVYQHVLPQIAVSYVGTTNNDQVKTEPSSNTESCVELTPPLDFCPVVTPTPSPTHDPSTLTPSPSVGCEDGEGDCGEGGLESILIPAGGAIGVLSLVILVAIIVLCVFIFRGRHRKSKAHKRRQSNHEMSPNPIYNERDECPSMLDPAGEEEVLYAIPDKRKVSQNTTSDVVDGNCYMSTYQTNGECHTYHELTSPGSTSRFGSLASLPPPPYFPPLPQNFASPAHYIKAASTPHFHCYRPDPLVHPLSPPPFPPPPSFPPPSPLPPPLPPPLSDIPAATARPSLQSSMDSATFPRPHLAPHPTSRSSLETSFQHTVPLQEVPSSEELEKSFSRGQKSRKKSSPATFHFDRQFDPEVNRKRAASISFGFPYSSSDVASHGFLTQPRRNSRLNRVFHDLDEEGYLVPSYEERQQFEGSNDKEVYSRLSRVKSEMRESRNSREAAFFEQSDLYWMPSSSADELYNQLSSKKYREICRENISPGECLGSGNFGTVCKGYWEVPGGTISVAIKTLNPSASEGDRIKFLQEAAIMGQFFHPNVVKLHGVVTVGEPLMIVLELMPKGDLKCYLRKLSKRPLTPDIPHMLLVFCRQIAEGMKYLSKKAFVHRDLATRNVFLTDDLDCKIGDFGMARDLASDPVYTSHGGKVPLKWTAPEAIHYHKFSSASDVWSYGMVLFEIWSLGRKPFEKMSASKLMDVVESGYCQPPPPGCPRAIYKLMVQCWSTDPSKRLAFPEICEDLSLPDAAILNWSSMDKLVGERVGELGAPLTASRNLYPDLQYTYNSMTSTL